MIPEERRIKLYILLLFAAGIILYLPSIYSPFISDEIAFISRTESENISELLLMFDKKDYDGDYYRPLTNFLSSLLSSSAGFNYIYYRIFNFFHHAINGVLVFLLALLILKRQDSRTHIALFSGLFFIFFPLNQYSVLWHTDLFDRIMFSFYILSIIFFMKKGAAGVISILFFLCALLAKEMALSLPAIIFLMTFLSGDRSAKKAFNNSIPYIIVVITVIVFRTIIFSNNIFDLQDAHSGTGVLPAVKNVFIFLGMMVFPFMLREIQEIADTNLIYLIIPLLIILIYIAWYLYKNRRRDIVFILLVLLTIIMIIPASRLLMRWYMYLPSAGFLILLSYFLFTIKQSFRSKIFAALAVAGLYYGYSLYTEMKWISISRDGNNTLTTLVNDYKYEIENAGKLTFITIPAKVGDVPLFQLAFDHHLNHYLAGEKEIEVLTKSSLASFHDKIQINCIRDGCTLRHLGDNYFMLSGNGKSIKFNDSDNIGKNLKQIHYKNLEETNTAVFTFSEGKFHLIKGIK